MFSEPTFLGNLGSLGSLVLDIVRKLYPKLLILSKLSLIIGAVIVFTEINKAIGGSLSTAAYTPETKSI